MECDGAEPFRLRNCSWKGASTGGKRRFALTSMRPETTVFGLPREGQVVVVMVCIQDNRPSGPPLKQSVALRLTALESHDYDRGTWEVSSRELLKKLQQTDAALHGDFTLTYRNCSLAGSPQILVKTQLGQKPEDVHLDSDTIVVGLGNMLQLVVDPVANRFCTTRTTDPSVNASRNPSDKKIPSGSLDPEILWLREMASKRSGYKEFKKRHNRAWNNADVIKSWMFAVEFCDEYYKTICPTTDGGRKVKKAKILQALGIGATWMAEADKAIRILRLYGEDGKFPAKEVIQEVSSQNPTYQGSRHLLSFLLLFEKQQALSV